ncbi:efflux transporter outer membrane subunit [Granulicella sibirica]|uniref:Outer membrane component of tripartite multidrug resistance system n=1 Tax=Granulicella sibirica TaxID=2479048 RepID=A0A4Q0T0Q2_9BACT|nr:efflux transporter outer membrane subunit [Granulicella sibirica]RXH57165.1 Outer membrane component of tripartite multidrug resistance system [Granulicella sibirica]
MTRCNPSRQLEIQLRYGNAIDPSNLAKWNVVFRLGVVLSLAGISGCRVGPNYQKPSVQLQPFHNAPAIEARTDALPAPALDRWWDGFQDPKLTEVVERALRENLDLAAAMTRVQQARAVAKEAGARRLPAGTAYGSTTSLSQSTESQVGRLSPIIPGYDRDQNYYDLGVSASWETDIFGSLRRGSEAATAEAQAAEALRTGTRISVAAEAADAYLQIRGAQARLSFSHEQIDTDRHLVDLVRQRREAGVASDRELAQAEALLSGATATIPLLETVLEAQLNRLDVLMGAQPGTYAAELKIQADIPVIPNIPNAGAPMDLLRRRPDIIAAEREVAASNARIGQALAEYYPKLSLSGIVGSQALAPAHLFEQQGFQPIGVAGLRWRLFDFGRVDAEVKQARGVNAEALVRYRSSVLHAAEDVEDAFSLLVQSERRRTELLREIAQLQRVRDRSQESYNAGVIGLTDVLDADRQLLVAKDDLAVSREDAARAAVGSFRALGGGWQP